MQFAMEDGKINYHFAEHHSVGRGHDPALQVTNDAVVQNSAKREILDKTNLFPFRQCVGGVMTPPYNGVWNSYAKRSFTKGGNPMARINNYLIQAQQAKERFLTYDQNKLIAKLKLKADDKYLYVTMLSEVYRISRASGDMERLTGSGWVDGNTYEEVMTLLDLVCDSRENRYLSGRWKNMTSFGLMFHQNLLEDARDPWAEKFQNDQEGFRRACLALNGTPLANGDIAYAIELFDGLEIAVQLWLGDDEFPPNLRFLWDENALMYIKYETMDFAKSLLLDRIRERMKAHRQ